MNADLRDALLQCETDLDEVNNRFLGDEELYMQCLKAFLCDQTMADLDSALETQSWDDAFTAAHALKGLAGNMGFVPLYHSTAELVIMIRAGRLNEITEAFRQVKRYYRAVSDAICRYVTEPAADLKGV